MKRPAHIDANVVLRHLLADDPHQSPEADRLFAEAPAGALRLSALTLAEIAWVLASHWEVPRPLVASALQRILAQPSVAASASTRDAVARFAGTRLDFADCVLAAEAAADDAAVVTFDRDLQRSAGAAAMPPRRYLA